MQVIYTTGESLVTQYQLGSYGIWGANVGYKFNDSLSLRVGVNNILDKRIYRNAGTARTYNERGRSYFANLKIQFLSFLFSIIVKQSAVNLTAFFIF